MRLSTLLPSALNPQEAKARRGRTYESENKACELVNLDFFFQKLHTSPNVLTLANAKARMCRRVYLIVARDTRRQPGETRDPLTLTSRTTKKTRANEARHERPRQHENDL